MTTHTYIETVITAPTTRRLLAELYAPHMFDETDVEGERLVLLEVIEEGVRDDVIFIQPSTRAEYEAVLAAINVHALPWPRSNVLPRLGSWRRYHVGVAWTHAVIELLGWTLTDKERALMEALEEYGRQAPARLQEVAA